MSKHVAISPEETADRLAIRELIEAYARCADRRDATGQMALFTTDKRTLNRLSDGGMRCLVGPVSVRRWRQSLFACSPWRLAPMGFLFPLAGQAQGDEPRRISRFFAERGTRKSCGCSRPCQSWR